ncbi:uncharacterized protein A4U43_C01F32130 [Asparagus officinalis]|uniref:LOB domain-containing protein n=1 Tax=Asparagus officinalis TaxID=4686 RepID=A0A5P1FUQ5_ASPOF|nr:LOB domain-containing protein 41-like [Asparagus officinalis]ONK81714.1 uncharacterized protein A4U43_C01F32130 [Asparagus officinalis]
MNLINSGPDNLRPAIFRSLLYEACGRIVNPIYGSVGLLWSGSWQLCQAAVEAVLKGAPIVQIPSETAASTPVPPLKAYDIRHISKDSDPAGSRPADNLHKVHKTRTRFKRAGNKKTGDESDRVFTRAKSHESSGGSHVSESRENEASMASVDTVEASHVSQGEPAEESEVELELTLGFEVHRPVATAPPEIGVLDDDTCRVELGLELAAA